MKLQLLKIGLSLLFVTPLIIISIRIFIGYSYNDLDDVIIFLPPLIVLFYGIYIITKSGLKKWRTCVRISVLTYIPPLMFWAFGFGFGLLLDAIGLKGYTSMTVGTLVWCGCNGIVAWGIHKIATYDAY